MEISIEEIRTGQGNRLDSISDSQLNFYKEEAKIIVCQDGIDISNELFKFLQLYRIYDLVESSGSIPNEITSENVSDIGIQYDTNISIGSSVFYKKRYTDTLIKARGTFFHA